MIIVSEGAGHWYPAEKDILQKNIAQYLQKVGEHENSNKNKNKNKNEKITRAIIVPHAGHAYSGSVAAYAFQELKANKGKCKRIVVIGPSHKVALKNQIAIPQRQTKSYQTVLGQIAIDRESVSKLAENEGVLEDNGIFPWEHSVDNQIPFIQEIFKNEDIVLLPIIVGRWQERPLHELAQLFKKEKIIDEQTVVIVSSDFTHFGRHFNYVPFTDNVEKNLMKLDLGAAEIICTGVSHEFLDFVTQTKATICGEYPIALLMELMPASLHGEVLKYETSGNLTGDFSHTVSYVAMAFRGTWQEVDLMQEKISVQEGADLIKLARGMVESYVKERRLLRIEEAPELLNVKITPFMRQRAGGFVTLKKHGELRGCIGEIFPQRSVLEVVLTRALDAAMNDSRFRPVSKDELADIRFEISLLTPPVSVPSWNNIEVGRHGIVLNKRGRTAVFLPQVAPEQGWDLATTLTHLSLKAGLSADDWKEGASFQVFEAKVIHES